MIHFHGTPLTPRSALLTMAGAHFCVPFSDPRDEDVCQQIGQSIMFDNGAFTTFRQGRTFDRLAYYRWLEPRLGAPHWAVVPDVIGGCVEDQRALTADWPFPAWLSAPVWHLHLPIGYLLELADNWPRVAFGSSAQFWEVGSPAWGGRVDEAFDALAARHRFLPHIHMLRGMSVAGGGRWPFGSADSVNVARNFKDSGADPARMARRIDAAQCPIRWVSPQPVQQTEFAL